MLILEQMSWHLFYYNYKHILLSQPFSIQKTFLCLMKILLIDTWPVIESMGGAEKIFCDLANALAQKGHTVSAICHDRNEGLPAFRLDKKVSFTNIYPLPLPFLQQKFVHKLRELSLIKKRRKEKHFLLNTEVLALKFDILFNDKQPDIIISFQIETTYALKSILGDRIPIITMMHSHPADYFPEHIPQKVREKVEASSLIQVLRPEYEADLLKILPNARVVVIPNPVPQYIDSADLTQKTIINVGRISNQKRQILLVKAFYLLKDEFPEWKVQIWGGDYDVKLKTEIQNLISSFNLNDRVLLCGTSSNIVDKLKKASIFAFPSETEGFPLALTEAQSMGLPCIGCLSCPAVNTLIRHQENGLLAKEDPQSFAEALRTLMSSEELRLQYGRVGKLDMKAFSPEIVWNTWESTLQNLVRKA